MKEKLSVVIITKNEEHNIERCLKSVLWADEIVILDTGSTDNTLQICQKYGVKTFINPNWQGFGKAKKLAVEKATYNWLFSIDADEEVTNELKEEILSVLSKPQFKIYSVKRKSFYLGKIINYCGWNNDYPKRLFNKLYANFNEKSVHESVVSKETVGKLNSPILHYTYQNIGSHIHKINFYTDLSSQNNKKSSVISSLFRGVLKFIKMYFLQLGFLDGKRGFILSFISAFGVIIKYLKIYEKKLNA